MEKNLLDNPELYYNILRAIGDICDILISSYCCVVWTRPFLDRRKKAWFAGGAYAATMFVFNFMPWYINAMLVYILGAMAVFFLM